MPALELMVVVCIAVIVAGFVVLSVTLLRIKGSLRDLRYVAEVVRAFRRDRR